MDDELVVRLHDGDEAVDHVRELAMELKDLTENDDRYEEIIDEIAEWVVTGTFVRTKGDLPRDFEGSDGS